MTANQWVQRSAKYVRTLRFVLRADPVAGTVLPSEAAALDAMLEAVDVQDILKNDRTTTVAKITVANQSLILKRYNPRNRWHKIKRALRISRARRCWEMSFRFERAGLNVSPPLMMFEDRYGLIRMNAYFANEFLLGDELLTALPNMDDATREDVKQAVLNAFAKLRAARISHGDMKATNLLWVNNRLFFIDLDASQQHAPWSLTWQKSHNKDKRRFLQNWQGQPDLQALFTELEVS